MPQPTYTHFRKAHGQEEAALRQQLRWMSVARLLSFLFVLLALYYFLRYHISWCGLASLPLLAGFVWLVRLYEQTSTKAALTAALKQINQTELDLLNGADSPYDAGAAFIDPRHPYAYDLDVFGNGSLYQYLNRTTHLYGENRLAAVLLQPDIAEIPERQEAIRELSANTAFRQLVQAHGLLHRSEEKKIDQLRSWLGSAPAFRNKLTYYLLCLFPLFTCTALIVYGVTDSGLWKSAAGFSFVVNLIITALFARKLLSYISYSSGINHTLQQFAGQLESIQNETFRSPLLQRLQDQLKNGNITAGASIRELASGFNYLDTVYNVFVSPLINGLFLFHIHILYRLDQWKQEHQSAIWNWLQLTGEIEALNSLAGYGFNNPGTVFPELRNSPCLEALEMGHPLIKASRRICNDLVLDRQQLVILTGSNMSGKSTFLRTVGINLVLARCGAPVCASSFAFYPFDLMVSMRISDSLQDSESFFYAELKRLKQIIDHLDAGHKSFILLDEILRGTNSNDKHNGTVGLLEQLLSRPATGIIATHDITVAALTTNHPEQLQAQCFESEIVNNELVFDYKIKPGVCSRLSASFLMKKMGIIS